MPWMGPFAWTAYSSPYSGYIPQLAEGHYQRSLGQRPRNGSTTRCLAEGHIHTWETMP